MQAGTRRRRILVLNANTNVGVTVVQSLGRRGHECWVASHRQPFPAQRSRYAAGCVIHADPIKDRARFEEWIAAFLDTHPFDLVLPLGDSTLIPLHGMRDRLRRSVLAIPAAADVAFDKERVRTLAVELGIPTPETLYLEQLDRDALAAFATSLPLVLKPVRSVVWTGGGSHLKAAVVHEAPALAEIAARLLPVCPIQVQRFVPGHGAGVEVLASGGRIALAFAHRRIHESHNTSPVSTYRVAIEPPPALLRAAAQLMEALRWTGVAMVEFRIDEESGRHWLLEINGRFWGSLPLAVHAGADFPAALADLLLLGEEPPPFELQGRYYGRDVVQDLIWMAENRRLLLKPRLALATLLQWGRVLTGREAWDAASLADPLPFLHCLLEVPRRRLEDFLRRRGGSEDALQ